MTNIASRIAWTVGGIAAAAATTATARSAADRMNIHGTGGMFAVGAPTLVGLGLLVAAAESNQKNVFRDEALAGVAMLGVAFGALLGARSTPGR